MTAAQTAAVQEETGGAELFDREEWIRQKREERDSAYRTIDEAAGRIASDGEKLKLHLDLIARFPRYSVNNILLIGAQKPDAVRLGDIRFWNDTRVFIKRGETGIVILEPGVEYTRDDGSTGVSYRSKRIFDISQTTTRVPPETVVRRDVRLLLRTLASSSPYPLKTERNYPFEKGQAAKYDPEQNAIFFDRDSKDKDLFQAFAREIAVARMAEGGSTREESLFLADCASYIVCRRNSVDVSGFSFEKIPESFSSLDARGIVSELGRTRILANGIEEDMERARAPKDRGRDAAR